MEKRILNIGKRPAIDAIKKELGDNLIGVEIGVNKGYNASYICDIVKPKALYLIDPWDNFFDPASGEIIGEIQYIATKQLLAPFVCCEIIRKTSAEAVRDFKDNSLDFVYIDANHSHEAVLNDLEIWYPKVKKGGIFSGHDFQIVQEAIILFCQKRNIKLLSQQNEDWWIRKE